MEDVYPAVSELENAAAFWYNDARVLNEDWLSLLPCFEVRSADGKRGTLQRTSEDIRFWAFLLKLKQLAGSGDVGADALTKFRTACKSICGHSWGLEIA